MDIRIVRGHHQPRDVVLRREISLLHSGAKEDIAVPAPVAASVPHANAACFVGARVGCIYECLEGRVASRRVEVVCAVALRHPDEGVRRGRRCRRRWDGWCRRPAHWYRRARRWVALSGPTARASGSGPLLPRQRGARLAGRRVGERHTRRTEVLSVLGWRGACCMERALWVLLGYAFSLQRPSAGSAEECNSIGAVNIAAVWSASSVELPLTPSLPKEKKTSEKGNFLASHKNLPRPCRRRLWRDQARRCFHFLSSLPARCHPRPQTASFPRGRLQCHHSRRTQSRQGCQQGNRWRGWPWRPERRPRCRSMRQRSPSKEQHLPLS